MKTLSVFVLPWLVATLHYGVRGQLTNVNATFGSSPAPFQVDVDPDFIALTKLKASMTRFPIDVEQPDFTDGPPLHNATAVRDYWTDEYDWDQEQAYLNSRFKHYTTTIAAQSNSTYSLPVPLHFVHHRSNRSDAIPLIFIHGWPGSFLEVDHIIDGLTTPPSASDPAFHVVAPSIPGFGFSPAPTVPGFGSKAAAETFNDLMVNQLNYTHFVVQGGDYGGIILRFLAGNHPESVVSALSNFWVVPPNATDLQRFAANQTTPDETATIDVVTNFENNVGGYEAIQKTFPLQLGYAMADSPVGFTMWIYNLIRVGAGAYYFTPSEIITWAMMYYIQGPYAGLRFYKENFNDGVWGPGVLIGSNYPYVIQPVAISEFPFDIWYRTPLDWAQRSGNVVVRTVHDTGGHFAAVGSPELLLGDIRAFFGNASLSNTGIFKQ